MSKRDFAEYGGLATEAAATRAPSHLAQLDRANKTLRTDWYARVQLIAAPSKERSRMKFQWGFVALLAACGAFAPANQASAQQWIFCATCSSDGQFANAALSNARSRGREGRYLYAVGNPNALVMRHVDVRISDVELDPWSLPVDERYLNSSADTSSEPVMYSGKRNLSMYTSSGDSATPMAPTADEAQTFASAVRLSKNSVLLRHPTTVMGHNSFMTAQPEQLGPVVHAYLTAHFPMWVKATQGLLGILKNSYGKGPHACVIFTNGDSACYYFPDPRSPNTLRYIPGTAQNAAGEPISGEGGIGAGSGSGSPVEMGPVGSDSLSWRSGPTSMLICGYVGGKLVSCYVETW